MPVLASAFIASLKAATLKASAWPARVRASVRLPALKASHAAASDSAALARFDRAVSKVLLDMFSALSTMASVAFRRASMLESSASTAFSLRVPLPTAPSSIAALTV